MKLEIDLGPKHLLFPILLIIGIVGFSFSKPWIASLTKEDYEAAARIAPLVTAILALIALAAIIVQRDVARRRAAIDFFLKTEMDTNIIDLFKQFEETTPLIPGLLSSPTFGPKSPEHYTLRKWLNICELIAVGVNKGAFSERVSLDYWGDVLPDSFKTAKLY